MSEFFPLRPMHQEESEYIEVLCGGPPIQDSQTIHTFFRLSAEPFLQDSILGLVSRRMGARCADELGIDQDSGGYAFWFGSLFYAGIAASISPMDTIPHEHEEALLRRILNQEPHDLILNMQSRMEQEAEPLCTLIRQAEHAIGVNNAGMHALALTGAGVTHTLVYQDALEIHEVRQLEERFPELADLEDTFQAIEREER